MVVLKLFNLRSPQHILWTRPEQTRAPYSLDTTSHILRPTGCLSRRFDYRRFLVSARVPGTEPWQVPRNNLYLMSVIFIKNVYHVCFLILNFVLRQSRSNFPLHCSVKMIHGSKLYWFHTRTTMLAYTPSSKMWVCTSPPARYWAEFHTISPNRL